MSQQTTMERTHEHDGQACPNGETTVLLGRNGEAVQLCGGYGTICGVIRTDEDVTLVVYQGRQDGQWLAKSTQAFSGAAKADGTGEPWEVYVNADTFGLAITNASGSEASVDLLCYRKGMS